MAEVLRADRVIRPVTWGMDDRELAAYFAWRRAGSPTPIPHCCQVHGKPYCDMCFDYPRVDLDEHVPELEALERPWLHFLAATYRLTPLHRSATRAGRGGSV